MPVILRSIICGLVILIYPYFVYKGVQEGVVWFAPAVICGIYLYQGLNAQQTRERDQKLAIVVLLLLGTVFYQDIMAKLIPIIIQLSLLQFFGKTLLKGKGPSIVERFVRLEFPEVPPVLKVYCRHLTIVWTAFFAFNILVCLLLAIFAPVGWWAIYTGVMIFLLTGILMIAEYIWRFFLFRRIDLPSRQIPGIKASAKTMIVNGRKIWLDVNAS